MPAYAMVIVVEADDAAQVRADQARLDGDAVLFIGDPWEVKPQTEYDAEPEFDTVGVIEQHPA